jgi:hypothetical protein
MLHRSSTTLLALTAFATSALVANGCSKSEPGAATPTTQATTGSQAPAGAPDAAHHMEASFWRAVDARDAVIDGNLQQARAHSGELSKQTFSALPERWRPWVAEMQQNAGNAAVAADIDEAAQWIASVGQACGNCHWYSGEGPKFGLQHPPEGAPGPEEVQARMQRHAHAADDLWMGLVMPSDAAWKRGAQRLQEAPPEPPVREGEEVNAHFTEQLHQIKALGLRAQMARTQAQRAEVYGSLISKCAHCHATVARPSPLVSP